MMRYFPITTLFAITVLVCLPLIAVALLSPPCSFFTVRASSATHQILDRRSSNNKRRSKYRPNNSPAELYLSSSHDDDDDNDNGQHIVDGIRCVEVTVPLSSTFVRQVTVLEATASSQEDLVNMALLCEDDDEEEEESVRQNLNHQDLGDHNVTLHAGDPYGAVLWPAASAVANHLLESFETTTTTTPPLEGLCVLELGAGTGLVSIVAALGGAAEVVATDYEDVPLRLLRYAARHLNDDTTSTTTTITTQYLDLCDASTPLPPADVVVAADVMYEPRTGVALAHRVSEALRRGSRVMVGDSPGRPGRPAFLQELARLNIMNITDDDDDSGGGGFQKKMGRTCSGDRHDLICGKGSTSVSDSPEDLEVAVMDLHPNDVLL